MKRIGLVTNWNEKCAVAEYAKDLVKYVGEEVEFRIIDKIVEANVYKETRNCDVIHYNYCAHAFTDLAPLAWHRMGEIPRIFTFHESSDWWTRKLVKTGIADLFIVHDKPRDGMPFPKNVETIPFGVPEVDVSGIEVVPNRVGTFGCAFPWKGLLPLAYACRQLDLDLVMYLSEPTSTPIDWAKTCKEIREIHPNVIIDNEWRNQEDIVKSLAKCTVIALPFDHAAPIQGISASVRQAIAAQRPLVLTRFHHFSDLYSYPDDIYFTDVEDLADTLQEAKMDTIIGAAKIPRRVKKEMSWVKSAQMYRNIYKSIEVVVGQSTTTG